MKSGEEARLYRPLAWGLGRSPVQVDVQRAVKRPWRNLAPCGSTGKPITEMPGIRSRDLRSVALMKPGKF